MRLLAVLCLILSLAVMSGGFRSGSGRTQLDDMLVAVGAILSCMSFGFLCFAMHRADKERNRKSKQND